MNDLETKILADIEKTGFVAELQVVSALKWKAPTEKLRNKHLFRPDFNPGAICAYALFFELGLAFALGVTYTQ